MKKKPLQIAEAWTEKLCYLKYIVLALISILCFAGVYGKAKGTSPWDVFSMLHAGNFKLGGYLVGLVLLALILVGMCFEERFSAEFLPDGSCVFLASGPSVFRASQRPGKLHQRMQGMYKEMSF